MSDEQASRGGDDEQVVSWLAVIAGLPVIAVDGQEVGRVTEVAALPEDDIFHGIVFRHGVMGGAKLAPAADVDRITTTAVYLRTDSATAAAYAEFEELHVKRIGLRGILGFKHLGWKDSAD